MKLKRLYLSLAVVSACAATGLHHVFAPSRPTAAAVPTLAALGGNN